jgi:HAD superfamily hydrolase (TIGR01549 family)
VLKAVLFDWGNTLVRFEWDDELLAAGHLAGLAALGRENEAAGFTERFRQELLPGLMPDGDYEGMLRSELGIGEADVETFLRAEQVVWRPAHTLIDSAHALLESLRTRGVKLGIVANHWPEPGWAVRAEIERLGVAGLVDAIVLAGEVGARKPDRAIFEAALRELDVEPFDTMFVGDRLDADVRGAGELGMITVQALWFRVDDATGDPAGIEPDFLAFTPMDVLNAVKRVAV